MTVVDFEMDVHDCLYHDHEIEWRIKACDGDTKIEFSVYDESFQEAIRDNFDYVMDTVATEITKCVNNLWDDSKITDEEKAIFNKVMLMVIG